MTCQWCTKGFTATGVMCRTCGGTGEITSMREGVKKNSYSYCELCDRPIPPHLEAEHAAICDAGE
jgi:RNA polymerase-binding transcription factor DksA